MFEKEFPGNEAALAELKIALHAGKAVAFTGAGTSAPDIPTWHTALRELLSQASIDGKISASDAAVVAAQIAEDPLDAAGHLEDALTKSVFRARIAKIFDKPNLCTPAHNMLMQINFSAYMTLNFDSGLSNAYSKNFQKPPSIIRPSDTSEFAKWFQGDKFAPDSRPIVHLHGVPSNPETMVITGQDYHNHYKVSDREKFLHHNFKTNQIALIGFGFRDPFITHALESVLHDYPTDDFHFAVIGYDIKKDFSPLVRRSFSRKYKVRPIFYPVIFDDVAGKDNHNELLNILAILTKGGDGGGSTSASVTQPPRATDAPPNDGSPTDRAKRDFEKNLFVAPGSTQLYVEPKLRKAPTTEAPDADETAHEITIKDIIASEKSYAIAAPHEYGLTTLGRRLCWEFYAIGVSAFIRDAEELPAYRRKLEQDPAFSANPTKDRRVVILDNFDFESHERQLKEIVGTGNVAQIIILSRSTDIMAQIENSLMQTRFESFFLANLDRSDVRTLAKQLHGSSDTDLISRVVEKVYNDLLDLCIPLTPTNVIMYLSVVHREGDFSPLNRLQIIDRYIRDMLRRPSDAYGDSFSIDNKLDVISGFVVNLYRRNQTSFKEEDWTAFCLLYMNRTLVSFDEKSLFRDLLHHRLFAKLGRDLTLKYRLFYSYFLGRFFANRPAELAEFMKNNNHLLVEGLVEVISGLSADNTSLLKNLTERLMFATEAFYEQYNVENLDPHAKLEWQISVDEGEELWKPIADELAAGPTDAAELDKLKRSISAEKRSEDQIVVIRDFSKIEKNIHHNSQQLIAALKNAVDVDGALKIAAAKAVYRAYAAHFQIGLMFAPLIARQRYFFWNGVGFKNELRYGNEIAGDHARMTWMVVGCMPNSVSNRAAQVFGSRRLGEVFSKLAEDGHLSGFMLYLNYCLIIRSKPSHWERVAGQIIESTDRRALYLRYMLSATLDQFHDEVNTNQERGVLKRLVALIQAKRSLNKAEPGAKAVGRTLERLEKSGYFDKNT